MTKDEELKEARQFAYGYNLEYISVRGVDCPKIDSIADLALAFHHHRLNTAEPVKTAECDSCGTKHRIDSMTVLCEKCFVETNEI